MCMDNPGAEPDRHSPGSAGARAAEQSIRGAWAASNGAWAHGAGVLSGGEVDWRCARQRRQDARAMGAARDFDGFFCGLVPGSAPYLLPHPLAGRVQETEDALFFRRVAFRSRSASLLRRYALGPRQPVRRQSHRNLRRVRACALRSGRPMRSACRWSAISTTGMAGAHPMRLRHSAGVWELFIPRLGAGERYKYEIIGPDGTSAAESRSAGARHRTAARHRLRRGRALEFSWTDDDWMARHERARCHDAPDLHI